MGCVERSSDGNEGETRSVDVGDRLKTLSTGEGRERRVSAVGRTERCTDA